MPLRPTGAAAAAAQLCRCAAQPVGSGHLVPILSSTLICNEKRVLGWRFLQRFPRHSGRRSRCSCSCGSRGSATTCWRSLRALAAKVRPTEVRATLLRGL